MSILQLALLLTSFTLPHAHRIQVNLQSPDLVPYEPGAGNALVPYGQANGTREPNKIPGCTQREGDWDRACHPMDAIEYAKGARCCGKLTAAGRALQGKRRYFTTYRKQFKECHNRGFSPYEHPADLDCCEGLADKETRKPEAASKCLNNGYSCGRWGAEATPGGNSCQCPARTTCVQTSFNKYPNSDEFSDCHETGEFKAFQQNYYKLHCFEDTTVSCEALGAKDKDGRCYCDRDSQVCVGALCQSRGRGKFYFERSKAFIRGAGKLKRWQKRELQTLNFHHEVGCVVMTCDDFNAVEDEDAMHCRCPAARFRSPRGQLPQRAIRDANSTLVFSLQEAWREGFYCEVQYEDKPRCQDGWKDHATFAEWLGFSDRKASEPWCQCPRGCSGEHCRLDDWGFGYWWYPYFCTDCACADTAPASENKVVAFDGKADDRKSSHAPPVPGKAQAQAKIKSLQDELEALSKADRKKALRKLQLKYHPDKVDKDMETYSVQIFQFAQEWWDREFKYN